MLHAGGEWTFLPHRTAVFSMRLLIPPYAAVSAGAGALLRLAPVRAEDAAIRACVRACCFAACLRFAVLCVYYTGLLGAPLYRFILRGCDTALLHR